MVNDWRSTRQVPMPLVPSRASLQSAPSHNPARSKIVRSDGAVTQLTSARKLLVQAVHLAAGNMQHLLQALAAFQQAAVLKHSGGDGLRRVEVVVLQAAQPGAGDGRIAGRIAPARHGEDLLGMATEMIIVHVLIILPA